MAQSFIGFAANLSWDLICLGFW